MNIGRLHIYAAKDGGSVCLSLGGDYFDENGMAATRSDARIELNARDATVLSVALAKIVAQKNVRRSFAKWSKAQAVRP